MHIWSVYLIATMVFIIQGAIIVWIIWRGELRTRGMGGMVIRRSERPTVFWLVVGGMIAGGLIALGVLIYIALQFMQQLS